MPIPSRLVVLFALCLSACSLGMDPSLPTHVRQRKQTDCVVAALATLTRESYERVDRTRVTLGIAFSADGLPPEAAVTIAAELGHTLVLTRRPNLLRDRGLLWVTFVDEVITHAVYLEQGLIFDPGLDIPTPWVLWFEKYPTASVNYLLKAD